MTNFDDHSERFGGTVKTIEQCVESDSNSTFCGLGRHFTDFKVTFSFISCGYLVYADRPPYWDVIRYYIPSHDNGFSSMMTFFLSLG